MKGGREMSEEVKLQENAEVEIIVSKAETPIALLPEEKTATFQDTALSPAYDPFQVELLARESPFLSQCIEAKKRNVVGFGIGVRYKEEFIPPAETETQQMTEARNLLNSITFDMQVKDMFERQYVDFETYGYGFLEVVQDDEGLIIQLSYTDAKYIRIYPADREFTEFSVYRNGELITGRKRFRKFAQVVNGNTIYFKEMLDPRTLDAITGEYVSEGDVIDTEREANSLFHLKQGFGAYGTPRWEGVMLKTQGIKQSELLNFNYFATGKHTPAAIVVENGILTEESRTELKKYSTATNGTKNAHKWLILQAMPVDKRTQLSEDQPGASLRVEKLADTQQKDGLFGDYQEKGRQYTQSKFLLADIFTGFSKDFNVATAREIAKKTEEQVFQPERTSIGWLINNIVFPMHNFTEVEFYFKSPNLQSSDFQQKMFQAAVGALTPNQAAREYYESIGKEYMDNEEIWANIPLDVLPTIINAANMPENGDGETLETVQDIVNKHGIEESSFAVLKSVKKLLKEAQPPEE